MILFGEIQSFRFIFDVSARILTILNYNKLKSVVILKLTLVLFAERVSLFLLQKVVGN